IALYCDLIARAALDGMAAQMGSAGIDLGEMEEGLTEEGLEEAPAADAPAEAPAEG
ncbi:MAG: 30S ribosomal protein S2, partial [Pseudomonadota bacterium]